MVAPDMLNMVLTAITAQLPALRSAGFAIHVWDMTEGKSDEELRDAGVYNCDLEDYFRGCLSG